VVATLRPGTGGGEAAVTPARVAPGQCEVTPPLRDGARRGGSGPVWRRRPAAVWNKNGGKRGGRLPGFPWRGYAAEGDALFLPSPPSFCFVFSSVKLGTSWCFVV